MPRRSIRHRRTLPTAVVVLALCLPTVGVAGAAPGPSIGTTTQSFDDVPTSHRFRTEIDRLVATGITTGLTATTFGPTRPVTREQMATFLWRLESRPAPGRAASFADVPATSTHGRAIAWLAGSGVTRGIEPGRFDPTGTVTREQMASFLWRLEGRPAPTGPVTFSDVAPTATHGQAIAWLARSGITQGVTPDRFEPTGTVTRGQMAAFLARLADQRPDDPAGDAPDPEPTTPAPDEAPDAPPGADDGVPAPGHDDTEPAPGGDDEVTHPAPGGPPGADDGQSPGDDEVEDPAPDGPPGADDGSSPGDDEVEDPAPGGPPSADDGQSPGEDDDPDPGTDPGPAPPTGGADDMCDLGPLVEPLIGAVHDGATATDELPAADSCTFAGEHGTVSVVRDAGWSDLDAWIGWRHEPSAVDGLGDWALYEAPCSDVLDDCECVTPDASVDVGAHDAVLTVTWHVPDAGGTALRDALTDVAEALLPEALPLP